MQSRSIRSAASAVTVIALLLSSCSETEEVQLEANQSEPTTPEAAAVVQDGGNPFFQPSPLYLAYPPFDQIENSHYLPAFERGMAEHLAELDEIAEQAAAPTFENTIIPLELSGELLNRVATVFFSMAGAHT
ncbi:unnamed protein product, partial [Scytosiphon promiscuus]